MKCCKCFLLAVLILVTTVVSCTPVFAASVPETAEAEPEFDMDSLVIEENVKIEIDPNSITTEKVTDPATIEMLDALVAEMEGYEIYDQNGNRIDTDEMLDIPPIPVSEYYLWSVPYSHTFKNYAFNELISYPVLTTQAVGGRVSFYYFELNGYACTIMSEHVMQWETGIHNPVVQISTPQITGFNFKTRQEDFTVGRTQMVDQTGYTVPKGYNMEWKFAVLYEIKNGNQLHVHTMTSPTTLTYTMSCLWDATEFYYITGVTNAYLEVEME